MPTKAESTNRGENTRVLELLPSQLLLYLFPSPPTTEQWSGPRTEQKAAAYLLETDISPQQAVHSRAWEGQVLMKESREGLIVHQEILELQIYWEMVFCLHLITLRRLNHYGAGGEEQNIDCFIVNGWVTTGFWLPYAEERVAGALSCWERQERITFRCHVEPHAVCVPTLQQPNGVVTHMVFPCFPQRNQTFKMISSILPKICDMSPAAPDSPVLRRVAKTENSKGLISTSHRG